jgi:5,10-methylenetetrahydromethanopterin reductase
VTERFGLGISNCRPSADVIAGVRLAEALGAEIAFIAEDVNCRDSFQLCALSAYRTKRIVVGTGVVNPYTRTPTSLAMATATLEESSSGRALLGLGASSPTLIEGELGIRFGNSVEMMRETATIVRALLRGESVTFKSDRFTYADARLKVSVSRRRIPIYFAAMGPRTLRLAGEIADGVLLNVGASTAYVRWAVAQVREGAERSGRDPGEVTVAAWITAYLGDDHDAGVRRARRWLSAVLSVPRQGELLLEHGGFESTILPDVRRRVGAYPHAGDRSEAGELVPPEWAERMTIVGTREEARRRLKEYRDAGVQVPVLGLGALKELY